MPKSAPATEDAGTSAAATTTMMPGAELLLKALEDEGVEVVFGYPGGAVLPIYDALFKNNKIKHILVRHEQAAVHAAEGYARSTGKTGVVLVTSGPGATNAVTGLTDALMDSVPVVCLTGQVPTHLIGNDAFQEADTTGITRACTKHNYLVKEGGKLQSTVIEAFHVAASGRPGPVLIDLPKDILMKEAPYQKEVIRASATARYQPATEPDPAAISAAVDMMIRAERPVIYGGGGLINSGPRASELLTDLVHMTGWPTTLTLMGLGALSAADKHFLGMLGMHGTYEANLAMHGCDLMLNLGARFDDRVTGLISGFSPNSTKIHCDIDPSSVNKNVAVDLAVIGDATKILEALIAEMKKRKFKPHKTSLDKWWSQIEVWRKRDCLRFNQTGSIIKPQHAIKRLCEMTAERDVYVTTEVGQHQMWAAQYFDFHLPNRWMTSGPRNHGLRPAGGARRSGGAPRGDGDRHCRRGVLHDEHAGTLDPVAVQSSGEDVHHQQRMDGHGPAVAGTDPWWTLFGVLQRLAAGFPQTRRYVQHDRPGGPVQRRSRQRDHPDAGYAGAGDCGHPRRQGRKLLPDDPVGSSA